MLNYAHFRASFFSIFGIVGNHASACWREFERCMVAELRGVLLNGNGVKGGSLP